MLQCLRDYLLRTCSLRILSELHSSDYQSTSEHTYSCLERIFTDTGDRRPLLEQFLLRMSHTNYWQVRLRYVLVLFRVCKKLGLYELTSEKRMHELTASLEYVKCRSTLGVRHLQNEGIVNRKLRQYVVEPLYNYLIRVGENQPTYLQFARNEPPQRGLTDMFKLCNLMNMLFELRQPCKIVLTNYVRVQLVEELVTVLYEEITMLYSHFKQVLQTSVEHSERLELLGLVELEVLIREEKTLYSKVCEFAFLFEGFTQPRVILPPTKLNIPSNHLRKVLQSEQLLSLKKQTARKASSTNNNPQWVLSEYIRCAIYDDETSIMEEQQSQRPKKSGKHGSTIRKKWREDRSDSDGIEGTVENFATLTIDYLRGLPNSEPTESAIST